MARRRLTGHRLRPGLYTSGSITAAYAITAWTVQADQKTAAGDTAWPWVAPRQALPAQRARISIMLDRSARGDGPLKGELVFSGWTFGQMSYVVTTFYPAAILSCNASGMFYDETDTAYYLNMTLYKPVNNDQFHDFDPVAGGYENIHWRYDAGVVVS